MSEEVLALGQREIDGTTVEFSPEEVALANTNGFTVEELTAYEKAKGGKETINAAIGGLRSLRNGYGQERNEPFSATTDGSEVVIESETDEKLPEAEESAT